MFISRSYPDLLAKEWEFLKLSASFFSIVLGAVLMPSVTMLFAGNLGKATLDGVGLANTIFNVVIMSVSEGYTSVFDTYGPQVYGSGQEKELGTVLVKCLLQGGLINLFIIGPYLNLVYVIDLLPNSGLYPTNQEQAISVESEDFREIAVEYLRITAIVQFLDMAVVMISKYFAIQNKNKFVYLVSLVMLTTHVLSNYLLVKVWGLGAVGLGLAAIIGRLVPLAFAITICVIHVKRGEFPWKGVDWGVLKGWKPMVILGISGAFNCFAEVGMYEITTFCSQFVDTSTLSVVIVLVQIMSVWWSLTFSFSRAAATLIGKALGEGNAEDIKLYGIITVVNTLIETIPLGVASYLIREPLVRIFNSDPEVVDLFTSTFWLACIGLNFTHLQTNLNQGVLIAFGEQKFIAWSMSIACYGVGLPFILVSIFVTKLGVLGIFLGYAIADTVGLMAACVKIYRIDITKEIEKSQVRIKTGGTNADEKISTGFENPAYSVDEGEVKMNTSNPTVNDEDFLVEDQKVKSTGEKEVRMVLIAFLVAGIICVTCLGLSLFR